MKSDVRKSGIEVIGDVPWGTHLCQFYQTKEDLIDILVPYFKTGLENNEYCMWVTSNPLDVHDARNALAKKVNNLDEYIQKGQIEIVNYSDWYTRGGCFEPDNVLKGWAEIEIKALENGYDGFRATGCLFWVEKKDWKRFYNYEAAVDSVIGKHRMLAICSYSLDKCKADEVIDVIDNHKYALIKKEGKWVYLKSSGRERVVETLNAYDELRKTQKEFLQTENMALIGRVAAGVAHEINNPLAYILTNLNVLKKYIETLESFNSAVSDECVVPEKKEHLKELAERLKIPALIEDMPDLINATHEGAERIRRIVQDLLIFARPDTGLLEDININNCIETTLGVINGEFKNKAEFIKDYGVLVMVHGNQQ